MKPNTLVRLIVLLSLTLLLVLPALAQDPTAEATDSAPVTVTTGENGSVDITVQAPTSPSTTETISPFIYLAYGGVVLIVVVLLFNLPAIMKIVAPLIPAETALQLAKGMVPAVSDTVLNDYAAKTPTPLDENLLILALQKLGYTVTKDTTGYHTKPPSETGPTLPSSGAGTTWPTSGS